MINENRYYVSSVMLEGVVNDINFYVVCMPSESMMIDYTSLQRRLRPRNLSCSLTITSSNPSTLNRKLSVLFAP